MNNKTYKGLVLVAGALLMVSMAHAQLGRATPEELARKGNGPGPIPGAGRANVVATTNEAPSADPKDFSGTWRQGGGGGGAPGGAAGGMAAGGAPGGAAPGGGPSTGGGAGGGAQAAAESGVLPDRIICLPPANNSVGGDGPLLITQTPEQITWAAEEMHAIRRIFLKGESSKNFKPNYLGEAIGHWDGNTLVVETSYLKSLPAGAKMVERWTKSADGKNIQIQTTNVDVSGKPIGNARTSGLTWSPGEELLEWICEDYNDEWLPGGTDFKDQVAK